MKRETNKSESTAFMYVHSLQIIQSQVVSSPNLGIYRAEVAGKALELRPQEAAQ